MAAPVPAERQGPRSRKVLYPLLLLLVLAAPGLAAAPLPGLEAGFAHPPDSARPWVYWFWLNGNVTSNGITADLEAMQKVGLGGVLIMDVDQGTPKGPVKFGSPQWRGLFQHACAEAHRLGLQVNMNNDPGWCGSGGPWVTPELSMQKVVWSETFVKGPGRLSEKLPMPETKYDFYRDVALLAFPTLAGDEARMADFLPRFTSSSEAADFNPQKLVEGGVKTGIVLANPAPTKPSWVQVQFGQPYTARELRLQVGLSGDQILHGTIEAANDGRSFNPVREFDAEASKLVADFPAVTARQFRLVFRRPHPDLKEIVISELELSPRLRIADIEAKASFVHRHEYPGPNEFPVQASYGPVPDGLAVRPQKLLNLTGRMQNSGQLEWDVPPGCWTLLRLGHTSMGTDNHPAPDGGHGLECDKLRKEGIQAVFNGFIRNLVADNKGLVPQTLVSTHVDSWEVGSQNWTANLEQEFLRRRGYELTPFLPALTGRVVGNLEISERFLRDFRQTIAELLVDNYATELRRLANRQGLRLSVEAYDSEPCDDLTYACQVDEPMAEFWMWPPFEMDYSCAEMASAAHLLGKPIVGVEAFTSTEAERWLAHPYTAKPFGDWAFCEGMNRLVLHRYTLQPWTNPERAPGMSMGPFGLHYERTQTWWNQSRPWHEYLSRCQFLLQQGRYVADICYVAPENTPQHWKVPFESRERVGYDYDVCPADIVLKRMSVKHGQIALPEGMSYRLLVLPDAETMTPELLGKVAKLVHAGATVLGPRPLKSPSLEGYPECDREVSRLANELWGPNSGAAVMEHPVGKGRVIWGETPQQVLTGGGMPPDFCTASGDQKLHYIHKTLPRAEVYFVSNPELRPQETTCAFRVQDRRPELWWPDTGRVEKVAVYDNVNGTIRLPLRLEPAGSVFVIFPEGNKMEPGRIVAVSRNGQRLLSARSGSFSVAPASAFPRTHLGLGTNASGTPASTPSVTSRALTAPGTNLSSFTFAVWAKPDVDVPLPVESDTGESAFIMERNDALFPPPGHEVFGGPDHAGAGISLGRNGVCVFEHAPFYFAPVLVYATPLTNWTHTAVVYHGGRPSLYLNGRLVHEGAQSSFIVHSGVGVKHRRGTAPFQGLLGEFYGDERALTQAQVAQLMKAMPVPATAAPSPSFEVVRLPTGGFEAQAWESGEYTAQMAAGGKWSFEVAGLPAPVTLTGPWDLTFPPGEGAPGSIWLDRLASWSEYPDAGVRHFSGTATYQKTFDTPADLLGQDQSVFLDLGKVCVIAQVLLNGKDLGVLWKPPFRIEVTHVLKPGENRLEVQVVNLWVNRMIGDQSLPEASDRNPDGTLKSWPAWLQASQPNPAGRYTFTTWRLWKKDEPLRESGLLGPVRLVTAKTVRLSRR